MKTVLSWGGFAGLVFAALVLVLGSEHRAFAKTTDDCWIDHRVCYRSCKGEGEWCAGGCDSKLSACLKTSTDSKYQPSGPSTHQDRPEQVTPTGGVKDEPKPRKPRENVPPTGGTKVDPKIPPKVGDTRPPLGGGVFQPKTSGSGTSGPILLRTNGAGQPSVKSNGGRGPSSRFGGGLR